MSGTSNRTQQGRFR